jgi:predicted Zn-dependent peptidase
LAVSLAGTHRAVIAAQLRVGSRFEDERSNGISHFLEHMLYRGTPTHPSAHELAVAFERLGGSLVATTSSDTGTLEVSAPPPNLAAVIPLFCEVMKAPALNGIDTERGIVREEILESLDDDGKSIGSDDLIRQLLFPNHPLGQPISGTLAQLATFTVDALHEHHRRFYCGANTVVAVAGPIEPKVMLDALERELAGLPTGKVPEWAAPPALQGPTQLRVIHRASQTEISLGFRAPGLSSEDEPAMDLLSRVLDDGMSTRLYHQLCDERGLCYDVSAAYESYADSGLLELVAETGHERVSQVIDLLLDIVSDLKTHGPTQIELDAARQRHRWQLDAMLDSPGQVAEYVLTEHLMGTERTPLDRVAELARVSVEDARAVARRWFTKENLGLVLVGYPKRGELARVERRVARFE